VVGVVFVTVVMMVVFLVLHSGCCCYDDCVFLVLHWLLNFGLGLLRFSSTVALGRVFSFEKLVLVHDLQFLVLLFILKVVVWFGVDNVFCWVSTVL